jgi:hypothetical protein
MLISAMPNTENQESGWWSARNAVRKNPAWTFRIQPLAAEGTFELSCEGLLRGRVIHRRLIDAIVQAVQMGREIGGTIQILDVEGNVADVLPMP